MGYAGKGVTDIFKDYLSGNIIYELFGSLILLYKIIKWMKKNVLHILRKSTQLRATFINNQISNHINYKPFIVFKENVNKRFDGGYANFDY